MRSRAEDCRKTYPRRLRPDPLMLLAWLSDFCVYQLVNPGG